MSHLNPETRSLWAARVAPWEIRSGESFGAPGSGLFKSTDGGDSWRQLTRGLPAAVDGLARIGIGIAPSHPSRVYALAEAKSEKHGLYRSDDAGESWERVNDERRISGRSTGAAGVAVAPDNPDLVYVANTSTYRSTDGGRTFTAIKGAPGGDDYQRIWINPENPKIIALSSDQGATISVNAGATWSSWYNQPTAQFYHVITDNRFPYWVYGAQQESGSIGTPSRSDYGEISFRDWHSVGVEEYGYIAPDPRQAGVLYGGRISRTDQATGEVQDISPEAPKRGKYRYVRTEPVVFSPVDPRTLYFGANVLFKTSNGGRTWQIISPDLTREKYDTPANLGVFSAADPEHGKHRGVIYAVAPSFKNGQWIWVGTDDGLIHLTQDGGKTWRDVTPPELTPWSKVWVIEASHFEPMTAFAAVNRFRLDDLKPYIYRTRDGGKTWRKITEGLPSDAPVNVIREDRLRKGLLFAGTERAVFVSFDDGDHWQPLQLNLPHTSMRDLTIHEDDLIVGTHGRSFWILDDISPLRQLSAEVARSPIHLYRPQIAYRLRWNRNTDTPLPPEVPAGKNPPDGAIFNYQLGSAATGEVTLEIFDLQGNSVRRFSSDDSPEPIEKDLNVPTYWVRPARTLSGKAEMHRFVWDLHYPSPDSVEHEYPISAIDRDTPREPRGPPVLPGRYTVKLSVGDQSVTQRLIVEMDPRVKTPRSDLIRQFELGRRVAQSIDQSSAALKQAQRLRAQLKNIKGVPEQGKLAAAIAALDAKAESLEGKRDHSFSALPTARQERKDLTSLNQTLRELLQLVNGADAAPSRAMVTTDDELRRALNTVVAQWNELGARDLIDLNAQLKQIGLPKIAW